MKTVNLDYSQLLGIVSSKKLLIQYYEDSSRYNLFAVEPQISWETSILKGSSDATDFETNYKDDANKSVVYKTQEGLPKILAAVSPDDVSLYVTGDGTSVVDVASQYIDSNFQEEIQLQGMAIFVKGGEWGDSVTVQVGYMNGAEWTPLKTFGNAVPMKDETGWQEHHYQNNAVSVIPATVKVRTILNTSNPVNKKLLVHYITHK